jgi:hypothetical protein
MFVAMERARVSQKLRLALLQRCCDGTRQYQIANAAGIHPTVMSALVHDIRPVRPDDARVIAIGKVLGLKPQDCFAVTDSKR